MGDFGVWADSARGHLWGVKGVGVGCGLKGLPQIKIPLPQIKLPSVKDLPPLPELPDFGL